MKTEDCPVRVTADVIGGKWKPLILFYLKSGTRRFNELRRLIPEATHKMLTEQLRQLEADDVIVRKVYAEVPPRVEYSLSAHGRSLRSVLEQMARWGERHRHKYAHRQRSATASDDRS